MSPARPAHNRRLFRRSRRREEKLRHGVERALARGDHRTARHLEIIYLRSFDAKHCAAHEANRKLRPNRRLRQDELVEVASNTSVFRPCDEPVDLYPRRKGPDSYRPITDPGIENRTRQKLVTRAMEPFAQLHPDQFALRGGHEAVTRAMDLIRRGHRWVVPVDIANCYPSLNERNIAEFLPLPGRVTGTVMVSSSLNLVPRYLDTMTLGPLGITSFLTMGRQGLPQGSAASNLALEIVLSSVMGAVPDGVCLINFADNFWVFGRTRREAVTGLQALRDELARHPAGPFETDVRRPRRVCDGFDILGYRVRRQGGPPRAEPTPENVREFHRKYRVAFGEDTLGRLRGAREPWRMRGCVQSWCSAFRLWENVDVWRWFHMRRVDRDTELIGEVDRVCPA